VQGDACCGTHAVPRVTSVNPGACKYNHRDEPWNQGGSSSILTRTSERGTSTTSGFLGELSSWWLCMTESPVTSA
jgi:hypothetical protein